MSSIKRSKVPRSHRATLRASTRESSIGPAGLALDSTSNCSMYRQLYDKLRTAILEARLRAGAKLPSTRSLAEELAIARNTVMSAYEQLLAEGYLEGKTGSGTYVARTLPEAVLTIPAARQAAPRNRNLFHPFLPRPTLSDEPARHSLHRSSTSLSSGNARDRSLPFRPVESPASQVLAS